MFVMNNKYGGVFCINKIEKINHRVHEKFIYIPVPVKITIIQV